MNHIQPLTAAAAGTPAARPRTSALALCLALCLALTWATAASSQDDPNERQAASPGDPVAESAAGLADEELAKRRAALETWTFEPVAIEETHWVVQMDRRNSSFSLFDRRTGRTWYSSWGRKGFASMLLKSASSDDGVEEAAEWVPIDRVRRLVAEGARIRFSAGPSKRGTPSVDFVMDSLPHRTGLRLEYEVPLDARPLVQAVRIFDDCFWVADSDDEGGIVLPRGLGEQLDADVREPVRRRLCGTPLLRPEALDGEPASLNCVGFLKKDNALLVRWFETFTSVEVERRRVDDPRFPGTYGVFFSLHSARPRGAVEVYTLGRTELGAVDVTRGYRELLGDTNPATLRYKTSQPELRGFLGAAFFSPAIGSEESKGSSFAEVSRFARDLKARLEIDRAAFVLREALQVRPAGEDPPALTASAAGGGDDGLVECVEVLRELGYLSGVDVPLSQVDECAEAVEPNDEAAKERPLDVRPAVEFTGPLPAPEARAWARRREILERADPLGELRGAYGLDLLLARETPVTIGEYDAAAVSRARGLFYSKVFESFPLVGVTPGTELDVRQAVYLGGYLEHPGELWTRSFFPFLPAAFGHSVRFGVPLTAALKADDPKSVLFHLLLGEVPLYETPRSSEDWSRPARDLDEADPRWTFARDAGWARGKGLSAYEVFLRNTYELLSHVARDRGRSLLLFHNRLTPDGSVRETYFGQDMRIVVNVGDTDYEDEDDDLILPPYGFFVRYPFLLAFHALRANGYSYDEPAFYVIRSLEGKMIYRASRVSIYRGFGPSTLHLGGKQHEVPGRIVTRLY